MYGDRKCIVYQGLANRKEEVMKILYSCIVELLYNVNVLKITELCVLKWWILWYMNYVSKKLKQNENAYNVYWFSVRRGGRKRALEYGAFIKNDPLASEV